MEFGMHLRFLMVGGGSEISWAAKRNLGPVFIPRTLLPHAMPKAVSEWPSQRFWQTLWFANTLWD